MGIKYRKAIFDTGELARILGKETSHVQDITGIVTDSREAESGTLFIALKGERVDGHNYISQAIARGAAAVIAERMPEDIEAEDRAKVFVTPNSLAEVSRRRNRSEKDSFP